MGAANDLRDTARLISRNENDSAWLPAKTTWRFAHQRTIFVQSRKVLNLCRDLKYSVTVIFRTAAENKFINCLSSAEAEANFETTRYHYADK